MSLSAMEMELKPKVLASFDVIAGTYKKLRRLQDQSVELQASNKELSTAQRNRLTKLSAEVIDEVKDVADDIETAVDEVTEAVESASEAVESASNVLKGAISKWNSLSTQGKIAALVSTVAVLATAGYAYL